MVLSTWCTIGSYQIRVCPSGGRPSASPLTCFSVPSSRGYCTAEGSRQSWFNVRRVAAVDATLGSVPDPCFAGLVAATREDGKTRRSQSTPAHDPHRVARPAALVLPRSLSRFSGQGRNRTADTRIFSPVGVVT